MFCQKCGEELKEDVGFCSFCGEDTGTDIGIIICPKCRTELKTEEKFCSSCGTRTSESGMEKAKVGIRFGSFILDWLIVVGINFGVGFGIGYVFWDTINEIGPALLNLISILISIGYFTYFFGNGQTLGMKAMKIKLCGVDGTYPIGHGRGFLRWIGMLISSLVIGLGYLWILIDENKQGWHDSIAGTYVVVE